MTVIGLNSNKNNEDVMKKAMIIVYGSVSFFLSIDNDCFSFWS